MLDLTPLARDARALPLFGAAGTAIYFYDLFLTLPAEVEHVWKSPRSLIKYLFLANRYLTALPLVLIFWAQSGIFAPSTPQCQAYNFLLSYCTPILYLIWNAIMSIRVCALWGHSKYSKLVVQTCCGFWIVSCIVAFTLTTLESVEVMNDNVFNPFIDACSTAFFVREWYWAVWLPDLLFEMVIAVLAMYKLIPLVRQGTSRLSSILMRDGILWFCLVFFGRAASLGLYAHRSSSTAFWVVYLLIGLGSASMSRLVIDLKSWNKSRHPSNPDEVATLSGVAYRFVNVAEESVELGMLQTPPPLAFPYPSLTRHIHSSPH